MGDNSAIEWTEATWNPTVGCDRISPGCARCYAKALHDKRHQAFLEGKKLAPQYAVPFETMQLMETRLDAPLHWRRPRKVFVNSVSDLFHEDVPDAFIDRVFAVMALAPQHTFQILTKRAERMRAYMESRAGNVLGCFEESWNETQGDELARVVDESKEKSLKMRYGLLAPGPTGVPWPLPNVWLGVSVENPPFLKRLDELMQTPAALRFVSLEPLLGPVDLGPWITGRHVCDALNRYSVLEWVIVGGESGAGARPCDLAWVRSIVAQCKAAGVPVFVKQLGAWPLTERFATEVTRNGIPIAEGPAVAGNRVLLHDKKGGDPSEWPGDLRVREFPRSEVPA